MGSSNLSEEGVFLFEDPPPGLLSMVNSRGQSLVFLGLPPQPSPGVPAFRTGTGHSDLLRKSG